MAEEDKGTEEETGTGEETEEKETEEVEETPEDEKEKKDPEVEKAIKRRDLAVKRAQKAEAELKKYKEKEKEESTADPVAKANARLIFASARTVLTGMGIADKEDQKEILSVLDFSDIDVDDEDGPDEDAISEKIEALRKAFGSVSEGGTRRVPRTVKTNKSTKETNTDPDKARYARIIGGRS